MTDILTFPGDEPTEAGEAAADDSFLLHEGLELLSDFRSIDDIQIRDSVRDLVKSLAVASRRSVASGR